MCTATISRPALTVAGLVLSLVFGMPAQAGRQTCQATETQKQSAQIVASLLRSFNSEVCGSIAAVFAELTKGKARGGRQLLGPGALDVQAAERELQAARAGKEFADALRNETAGETDPARRLVIEAALLHDFGHYKARDLLVQRLLEFKGG